MRELNVNELKEVTGGFDFPIAVMAGANHWDFDVFFQKLLIFDIALACLSTTIKIGPVGLVVGIPAGAFWAYVNGYSGYYIGEWLATKMAAD